MMEITFRRDPTNYRPRINKHKSVKDSEQKKSGNYFLSDVSKLDKEEEDEDGKFAGGEFKVAGADKKGGKGGKGGKKADKDN